MNYEKLAVIPDLHGQDKLLLQVVEHYPESVGFVQLGDIFDSGVAIGGIKNCLDTALNLGDRITLTQANHEWAAIGAMCAKDAYRDEWVRAWGKLEKNTLRSYGIDKAPSIKSANRLRRALEKAGHLDLLLQAPMYFEHEDFIAVHAGLSRATSWETQRAHLDEVHAAMLDGEMRREEFPLQINSHHLGSDRKRPSATDKIAVSGHSSTDEPSSSRTTGKGRRVRLATKIDKRTAPLEVWQSWNGKVRTFEKD